MNERRPKSNSDTIPRETQALLALHDLGTRERATAISVRSAMLKEGFSVEEIRVAAQSYGGGLE